MKGILIGLLILLSVGIKSYGQANYATDSASSIARFQSYLLKAIRYPAIARENNYSGQIIAAFWLNEDKSVSDIKILKGLDDQNICEDEIVRCLKNTPHALLKISPDEYVCSFLFVLVNQEGEEIHNFEKVQKIQNSYKNFLFETKVLGYPAITKTIYTDERTSYVIPTFTEHAGKIKLLAISTFKTNSRGEPFKDSLYTKTISKYDVKGNLIQDEFYNTDATSSFKTEYRYNESGYQTDKVIYKGNGQAFNKTIYKYDKNGKKAEEAIYYAPNIDSLSSKTVFEYNDKGLEIAEVAYNGKVPINKISYKYINGFKQFEEDDNLYYPGMKTLKYFTDGLPKESYVYDSTGNLISKTTYQYDDKKRLVETVLHFPDKSSVYKDMYKFDLKGNKIEEITDISNYSPLGTKSLFEYSSYDKRGNWHTCKWLDGHTKEMHIIKREITYR